MRRAKGLEAIGKADQRKITSSGIDLSGDGRSASFLQEGDNVLLSEALGEGVEIMSMEQALAEQPAARENYGRAFARMGKDHLEETKGGYFIHVKENCEVELPVQACLFMKEPRSRQKVRNIVLVEKGARAHVITGCSSSASAGESFHLGLSEFFIGEGAYLNFTMVHSWEKALTVKPLSVAVLEEGAAFVSNYICLEPVKQIEMYPTAVLDGEGAKASFNSLILSHPGTLQDIGSRVLLEAPSTQAEVISRAVSLGGKVVARGHLRATAAGAKGHLECRGLVISEKGTIHAVPELETSLRDVDLSHEAAIGSISREEIEYLRSRGMTADEARSVIIRGFMDVGQLGLPEGLTRQIRSMEETTLAEGV